MNKSQRASETQPKTNIKPKSFTSKSPQQPLALLCVNPDKFRPAELEKMRDTVFLMKEYLTSDPHRKPQQHIIKWVNSAVEQYEKAFKASIGMPTTSDSVTTQHDAPLDVPTVPLSGFQLVQRLCYIPKLASEGSAAGGWYAALNSVDLNPFVSSQSKFYRVNRVTSWTVPRADGNANQGTFAGVVVPATEGAGGTEVMPLWSENWSPIGKGFAGIVTQYPLGDFPQLTTEGASVNIVRHFTSLGNTGGVTNVPVVFHVLVECLI